MLVCWSWARVCGSVPSMAETFRTTGRSARSALAREEDPGERPLAEGVLEAEAEDLVAHVGQP